MNTPVCKWTLDAFGGWETQCGEEFYNEFATPEDLDYKFFPWCGKPIDFRENDE